MSTAVPRTLVVCSIPVKMGADGCVGSADWKDVQLTSHNMNSFEPAPRDALAAS